MKKRESKEWHKLEYRAIKDKINDATNEEAVDKVNPSHQMLKTIQDTHSTQQSTFSSNTSVNSCLAHDPLSSAPMIK